MTDLSQEKIIGRNEPCPCRSGKKYKRCCGVGAAPKVTAPRADKMPGGFSGGMTAEQAQEMKGQFDPQMMLQFSQMLGKLPKGQLQKLQGIMQKAMAGKDVTREARELEDSLPVELQTMLQGFQMPGQMPGQPGMPPGMSSALPSEMSGDAPGEMSEEEARKIVEAAAKEGKISSDQASSLLQDAPSTGDAKAGMSKLWKKISGK